MASHNHTAGCTHVIPRSILSLPPSVVLPQSTSDTDTVTIKLLSRSSATSRKWKVSVNDLDSELFISTTVLNRGLTAISSRSVNDIEEKQTEPPTVPALARRVVDADLTDSDEESSDDDCDEKEALEEKQDSSTSILSPHGLTWNPIDIDRILVDSRGTQRARPCLLWKNMDLGVLGSIGHSLQAEASVFESRRPLHYSLFSFPVRVIPNIVYRTNRLSSQPILTNDSFIRFIALIYTMGCFPGQPRRDYWRQTLEAAMTIRGIASVIYTMV